MSDLSRAEWERIDRLLADALAQPEAEREAWLGASGASEEVLKRVRRMLRIESDAALRIGESAEELAGRAVTEWEATVPEAFPPGSEVGPYRIIREVGKGGMGTVYLAARTDDQYDRQVALKVVKRGMDTDEVLARFKREAQILARLEHPGIGRLYDAGATPDGRPYLVLEYVDGRPIDEFSDHHRLSLEERIELFLSVCEAVSFAHRNLVLHRDLKPSNILVSRDGPRLLDFGIGKILDEDSGESALTELAGRRLTPEYASPEQLAGGEISTASDVFGLGVVLYELLTGVRPNPGQRQRPSTAFTGDGGAAATEPLATSRGSTPRRLMKRLQGDLDIIVMKALHEDPARRYPSVEALAQDLRAHLDGFPVRARPDSVGYRVKKFVGRNPIPVLSSSGLGISILFFGIASTVQQAQTSRERDRAELARANAAEVAGVLEDFFTGAHFASRERIDTLTVAQFLDRSADQVLTELEGQPEVQGTLLRILGSAQREYGQLEAADSLLSAGVAALERADLEDPRPLLNAKQDLGHLRGRQGQWAEARALYESWFTADIEFTAEDRARANHNVALAFINVGQFDSAAMRLDTAIAVHQKDPERDPAGYASTLTMRSGTAQRLGDLELAVELAEDARDMMAEELGSDHPTLFPYEQNFAFMLSRAGRSEEAEPLYARMVDRYRNEFGTTPDLASLLQNYGNVLRALDRPAEALPLVREAVAIERDLLGPDNPQLTFSLDALGTTLMALDQNEEALTVFNEQLSISLARMGGGHPGTAASRTKVAAATCSVSPVDEDSVEALFDAARSALSGAYPDTHPAMLDFQVRRGRCYARLGKLDEVRAAIEETVARAEAGGTTSGAVEALRELLGQTPPPS